MIFKDQLLDAYMSLGGSATQHLAMFLTIFLILKDPHDALDMEPKSSAVLVYDLSLAVHSIGFLLKLVMKVKKVRLSKIVQTLDALFVIFHVYFMLVCIETFSKFQKTST